MIFIKRDSLIFYNSHYQILKDLSDEDFGKLYKAFFEAQLGNEIDLPDHLKIAFGLVNNQLVMDAEKYDKKCEKNKANGNLGGRPRNQKSEEKPNGFSENPKKPNGYFENPEKPNGYFENPNKNKNDNKNKNENENDNNNYNENENKNDNDLLSISSSTERIYERSVTTAEFEVLRAFLQVYPFELIEYAIEVSACNNKKNLNYVRGILNNWKNSGFNTKQDVLNSEIRRDTKNDENPCLNISDELMDYDWLNDDENELVR